MAVLDVVEGVVVVVQEVPAGDVVDESVADGVGPVGEGDDQVLGRQHPGRSASARWAPRTPFSSTGLSLICGPLLGSGVEANLKVLPSPPRSLGTWLVR